MKDTTTITYQGQEVPAVLVAELSDSETSQFTGKKRSFWLKLWREESGQYYAHRQSFDHGTGENPFETSHRLSLRGAILWVVSLTGYPGLALRKDAASVLGGPAVLDPTRRFSDGSMLISLHLKPAVASLVRAVAEIEDDTPLGTVYTGLEQYVIGALTQGGGHQRARDLEELFSDNAPAEYEATKPAVLRLLNTAGAIHAEAEIGRDLLGKLQQAAEHNRQDWQRTLTDLLGDGLRMASEWGRIVELDDVAETLVRRYHRQEYGEARYENVMPGDVVNGLVVNWLEAMLQIHEGRTDDDAIEEARNRRRHGLSDADDATIEQVEQEDEEDAQEGASSDVNWPEVLGTKTTQLAQELAGRYALSVRETIYFALTGSEHRANEGDQADGSMAVTVRFKPEPARLLRAACLKNDCAPEAYLYESTGFHAATDLSNSPQDDRDFRAIFDDNAPDETEEPATNRVRYPAREPEPAAALHGLNAAKPEPISADEIAAAQAVREGQPAPMRDVLIDLAAGWRIEGAEKGGRIAGVLARCADALEAAVAGKEGR